MYRFLQQSAILHGETGCLQRSVSLPILILKTFVSGTSKKIPRVIENSKNNNFKQYLHLNSISLETMRVFYFEFLSKCFDWFSNSVLPKLPAEKRLFLHGQNQTVFNMVKIISADSSNNNQMFSAGMTLLGSEIENLLN